VLTCEENFQDYYGQRTDDQGQPGQGTTTHPRRWRSPRPTAGWTIPTAPSPPSTTAGSWRSTRSTPNLSRASTPGSGASARERSHKRLRLREGRRLHGHDEEDRAIYKFVSSGTYEEGDREANMELLSDGMLYVADFAQGKWTALDYENNELFKDNGYKSQAEVLVRTIDASTIEDPETELPIGTPLDRCEDIEVHPKTGQVYAALTNNELHGNFYGQISASPRRTTTPPPRSSPTRSSPPAAPDRLRLPRQPPLRRRRQPLGHNRHLQQQPQRRYLQLPQEQRRFRDAKRSRRRGFRR
jgi:hypothetical protein